MGVVIAAIGAVAAAAASAVSSAAAAIGAGGLLGGLGGKLLGIALSVGLNVLLALLNQPKVETPSDSQRTKREAVAHRRKIYGRGLYSGQLLSMRLEPDSDFFEDGGHLWYMLLAIRDGETTAINGFAIDGKMVDVDENGDAEKLDRDGETIIPRGYVTFRTRLGTDDQTVFTELVDHFGDTVDETWRGVGTTLLLALILSSSKIYERLPNGQNTNFSVLGDFAKVWDPRDEAQSADDRSTWTYSPNAALVILDHLKAPATENGYAIPLDALDVDSFAAAADLADIVRAAPREGTRRTWELHGPVDYSQPPSNALSQMLAACDGKLVPSAAGKIGLLLGGWIEPAVTLTGDAIVSLRQTRGGYLGDQGTVIKSRYLSPEHGWIEQDAIEYVHPAAATRGRAVKSIDTLWSANHGQTRHVMKIQAARMNSPVQLVVETKKQGLLLVGERFVRIRYRRIDTTFEITTDMEPVIDQAGYLTGFRFGCVAMTAADFAYDEAVDGVEPPPVPPEDDEASLIPGAPTLDVVMRAETGPVGEVLAVVAAVTIEDSSATYYHRVEYRETGATGPWTAVDLDVGTLAVDIGGLIDGRDYDFRARARSASGDSGWSDVVVRTVTYDTAPPGVPRNVSAVGGAGEVDLSWRGPASDNVVYVAVYRGPSASFGAATLVDRVGTLRSASETFVDGPLAAGTYHYFLTAGNGSAVESAPVATGGVTVTA
ncbi:hypothetical protein ATO13_08481 [Stappia sp. 22II-S9-Z10]|nr:hypothetical protein ATO13_08481 [Stappia sp. 22II-S9-Z10]